MWWGCLSVVGVVGRCCPQGRDGEAVVDSCGIGNGNGN